MLIDIKISFKSYFIFQVSMELYNASIKEYILARKIFLGRATKQLLQLMEVIIILPYLKQCVQSKTMSVCLSFLRCLNLKILITSEPIVSHFSQNMILALRWFEAIFLIRLRRGILPYLANGKVVNYYTHSNILQ